MRCARAFLEATVAQLAEHRTCNANVEGSIPSGGSYNNSNIKVTQMAADEITITITRKEYDELLEDSKILQALYAGGVDNWEWYDDSLEGVR